MVSSYLPCMNKSRFWFLTVATIAWMFVMRPFTPGNIVAFEFARTVENATQILAEWGSEGIAMAKLSLNLDFIFLVLYSWAISLGCRVAANFSKAPTLISIGNVLSKIIWIAGLCDLVENVCLILVIRQVNETLLEVAFWMAATKFALVGVALLFMMMAAIIGITKGLLRFRHPDSIKRCKG